MFAPFGPFGDALIASAQQYIVPLIITAALIMGGATWALGKHDDGKRAVLAALMGGAVMMLAVSLSKALVAVPH